MAVKVDVIKANASLTDRRRKLVVLSSVAQNPLKPVIDESILKCAAGADSEILQSCLYGICVHETSTSR